MIYYLSLLVFLGSLLQSISARQTCPCHNYLDKVSDAYCPDEDSKCLPSGKMVQCPPGKTGYVGVAVATASLCGPSSSLVTLVSSTTTSSSVASSTTSTPTFQGCEELPTPICGYSGPGVAGIIQNSSEDACPESCLSLGCTFAMYDPASHFCNVWSGGYDSQHASPCTSGNPAGPTDVFICSYSRPISTSLSFSTAASSTTSSFVSSTLSSSAQSSTLSSSDKSSSTSSSKSSSITSKTSSISTGSSTSYAPSCSASACYGYLDKIGDAYCPDENGKCLPKSKVVSCPAGKTGYVGVAITPPICTVSSI
jgi:hypothetical protein